MRRVFAASLLLAGIGTALLLAVANTSLLVPYLIMLAAYGLIASLTGLHTRAEGATGGRSSRYLLPIGLTVVGGVLGVLAYGLAQRDIDIATLVVFFVGLILVVGGLVRLGWLLMTLPARTRSRALIGRVGASGASTVALALLAAVGALMLRLYDPYLNIMSPGPDAFEVEHKALVTFQDADSVFVREEYVIRSRFDYAVVGVEEIESREIPLEDVSRAAPFVDHKEGGVHVQGYEAVSERTIPVRTERLGLLRSKYTLMLPALHAIARNVRSQNADSASTSSEQATVSLTRMTDTDSRLTINMPRNSVVSVYPVSTVERLPDRDVVEVTQSRLARSVEVYFLRDFRTSLVRRLLSTSSEGEVLLQGLAWLFWPVVMILVSAFRKGLADRISGWFKRKREKPKSPMGFRML